jgi:hypothetical protein
LLKRRYVLKIKGSWMKRVFVFLFLFWITPAMASDIQFDQTMTQQMFRDFSQEAGALVVYRAIGPVEPLGLTGLEIGVEATSTKIHGDRDYWKKSVGDHDPPSYFVSTRLHLQKGLPYGFDLGLVVGRVLEPDITYAGGEVRYAILKGGAVLPAVAVRGSYSQTLGVDQLDLKTYGLDLSISKGFGTGVKIIPYGGIGQYWISSKPKNLTGGLSLNEENFSKTGVFAGVRLQVEILTITGQVDYVDVPSFSLRVGITW